MDQVRARAEDEKQPSLRWVVLDFRRVSSLDSSAVLSFVKMKQLAKKAGYSLVFTEISLDIRSQLEKEGLCQGDDSLCYFFADLDHGIEWCENNLLTAEKVDLTRETKTIREQLGDLFPEGLDVSSFLEYLEKRVVDKDYVLIKQDELTNDLCFVESGQVTAQLEREDGGFIRLRTMGAGAIVGEIGMYSGEPRSASVVADEPSTIYVLSKESAREMTEKAPELAASFHEYMARLLAERLAHTNKTIQAVLD